MPTRKVNEKTNHVEEVQGNDAISFGFTHAQTGEIAPPNMPEVSDSFAE